MLTCSFVKSLFNMEVSEEQSYILWQSLWFRLMGDFIEHDVLLPGIGCPLAAELD